MTYNFQLEALQKLLPVGFKKQREFFFLVHEPSIMVIFRRFEPGGRESFFLAYTHTFFESVRNKNGKYLLPTLLEHYPVSISTDQLREQYSKHSSVYEFDCALHHLARTLSPEKATTEKTTFSVVAFFKKLFSKEPAKQPVNPVEVTLQEGMRLMTELSPALSSKVLSQNTNAYHPIIGEQLIECNSFLNKQV